MIGVRLATPQDAMGIAQAHVETWRATYPTLLPHDYLVRNLSVDSRALYWRRTLEGGNAREAVLVAVEGDAVVGFCSVGGVRKRPRNEPAPRLGELGEVFTLYVLPDFQNQGIGRMLLANGFARMVERGFESALLWVVAGNPSRFFYEAMGGRAIGRDTENFAGAAIEETCYAWPELPRSMTLLATLTDRRRADS